MATEEAIEEIEALKAILEEDKVDLVKDDVDEDQIKEVHIHLTPLTASQEDKQYVSLNLVIKMNADYPSSPPDLEVRNPRGLEDSAVTTLINQMKLRCEEYVGCPVLFELIEMGREFLTERNVPVCQCCICLNNIVEEDSFLKTQECLHFFHRHCLGRYITSVTNDYQEEVKRMEKENKHSTIKPFTLHCPVCREIIDKSRYNAAELLVAPEPVANTAELVISLGDEVKKLQAQMNKLFLKQKAKGGIIDLEEERKKYLVLTGSNDESRGSQEFNELSPTDFNPAPLGGGGQQGVSSPVHRVASQHATPTQSPKHVYYNQQKGGKGGNNWKEVGKGGRTGGKHQGGGNPQEPTRGKSHHQMKKMRGRHGDGGGGKSEGGKGRKGEGGGGKSEGGKGTKASGDKKPSSREDRLKQL